jgi:hypothetical protein
VADKAPPRYAVLADLAPVKPTSYTWAMIDTLVQIGIELAVGAVFLMIHLWIGKGGSRIDGST